MPDMKTLKIGNKTYDIRDSRIGNLADLNTTDKDSVVDAINETLTRTGPTDQQVQDAVDDYLDAHPTVTGTFTNEAKNALIALLEKVAYIDGNGQTYLDTLTAELFAVTVTSIAAVFTQGQNVIYDTDSLDTLKQYLVVTANYSDGTSAAVTTYTLSGTLTVGTSTITATYGGQNATFTVTVTAAPLLPTAYQQVEYIKSTGTQHIVTDISVTDSATGDNSVALYAYDIDFKFDEWQSAYGTNIMAGFGSNAGKWIGYNNSKAAIAMGTSSGNYFTTGTVTDRHQYHWSISSGTGTYKRDDNVTISRSVTYASSVPIPFDLFTIVNETGNNFHFNGKFYSCKMYKSGNLVLDLYPCYRKADTEIGLYDLVNDRFYTNNGTGTFQKGADVS